MYRIIEKAPMPESIMALDNVSESWLKRKIIVCEKKCDPTVQGFLIELECGRFSWRSWYIVPVNCRSIYPSIKAAINSRFQKDMTVFVLANKTEFKEFIKPRIS